MDKQCFLQKDGTTVAIVGTEDDSLQDVVRAAHNEYKWLQENERVQIFATHR